MKTMMTTMLVLVASSISACVPDPAEIPEPKGQLTCSAPGTRCDYGDQCCSEVCDANECRGPIPQPTAM
jgi:hypothetical protein